MVHLFRSPLEIKGPYQADAFFRDHVEQALALITEAQAAGPAGAEEAEIGTEAR